MNIDIMNPPWWVTVSGAGTPTAALASWADDHTRHRSHPSTTYTSVDSIIGRHKSVRDLDNTTVSG